MAVSHWKLDVDFMVSIPTRGYEVLSFTLSGNKTNCGIEFCHSTCKDSKIEYWSVLVLRLITVT